VTVAVYASMWPRSTGPDVDEAWDGAATTRATTAATAMEIIRGGFIESSL
jgi:hypothetical protein